MGGLTGDWRLHCVLALCEVPTEHQGALGHTTDCVVCIQSGYAGLRFSHKILEHAVVVFNISDIDIDKPCPLLATYASPVSISSFL